MNIKGYFGSVSQKTAMRIITKNTKTHPPPKYAVVIERLFNGFPINLQGKKQVENKKYVIN